MPRRSDKNGAKGKNRAARAAARAARDAETKALRGALEERLRRHALAYGRDELLRRLKARGVDTAAFERPLPPGFSIGWTARQLAEHQLFTAPRDERFLPLPGSLPDGHPLDPEGEGR
jgi:hypothetical protein